MTSSFGNNFTTMSSELASSLSTSADALAGGDVNVMPAETDGQSVRSAAGLGLTPPVRSTSSLAAEVWLVCHTRPRCEKKFADLMNAENFEHYLPLLESVHRYGRRTLTFTKPLFPGYVFARIPWEQKSRIYQQDLLVRPIVVPDERSFVRQLHEVKTLMMAGIQVAVRPLLEKGRRVKIISGALRGVEGYIEQGDNVTGIVVAIDVLQQGLLVKVAFGDLEFLH